MQVEVSDSFPYPNMFLIAGRTLGTAAPPIEPVGALIVKQTVQTNGAIGPQKDIRMSDVEYSDPADPSDPHLDIRIETDLIPYKPFADLVAVRDSFVPGIFGTVRIDRGTGFGGFLPLDYGWRDRLKDPRKSEAGDAANFVPVQITDPANPPPLIERLKLPNGFENGFFNGGHPAGIGHLQEDNIIEFHDISPNPSFGVILPKGPTVTITMNDKPISPPVNIELGIDTVVYDISASHFLVTWRAVFPWEDRLADATLEAS